MTIRTMAVSKVNTVEHTTIPNTSCIQIDTKSITASAMSVNGTNHKIASQPILSRFKLIIFENFIAGQNQFLLSIAVDQFVHILRCFKQINQFLTQFPHRGSTEK